SLRSVCSRWRGILVRFAVESRFTLPWNGCSLCVEYAASKIDKRQQQIEVNRPGNRGGWLV
ncbi:hypothetical protein, partial [Paraburkholderia aspalathi]|uniref:hypothetical protein n=1 Tax=Paraburkholderia aspalathi TaxID=1324617 RepID=UPI001BA9E49A